MRLQGCLNEVSRHKNLDFPYRHSEQALEKIEATFASFLKGLQQLSEESDPKIVHNLCITALAETFAYVPLLGFILRSTEVRNAFEIHGPLLNLSRRILGHEAILVLSSEWHYSPITYHGIPELPDFVLMGLPAPESANPLLIPLAGHELGHPVWLQKKLDMNVSRDLQSHILQEIKDQRWEEYRRLFPSVTTVAEITSELSARQTWRPAYEWGSSQAKETFCDVFGLRIFGESYLHAFAYLLSPGGYRSATYPNWSNRVGNLVRAANAYAIPIPEGYERLFADLPKQPDAAPQSIFLLELADSASQSVLPKLIELAKTIVNDAELVAGGKTAIEQNYTDLCLHIVPTRDPVGLADILNAGWKAFHDPNLWKDKILDGKTRDRILKELLLKSIEILEVKTRLEAKA